MLQVECLCDLIANTWIKVDSSICVNLFQCYHFGGNFLIFTCLICRIWFLSKINLDPFWLIVWVIEIQDLYRKLSTLLGVVFFILIDGLFTHSTCMWLIFGLHWL